ncbi:MAG: hypothetical protein ACJ8C4_09465 [Gemmataceae bacterium]
MSWAVLEPLVRTASPEIRDAVRAVADAANFRLRRQTVRDLVRRLGGNSTSLALTLAHSKATSARRLALEIVGQIRYPGNVARRGVRYLLADRSLPLSARLAATRALIRGLRSDEQGVVRLLHHFVAGLGRSKAIQRLDAVAPRLVRAAAAVAIVRSELLNRQRMRCPRCGAMRRRKRMSRHLWRHHSLLLDGGRAHTPWQALDLRLRDTDPVATLAQFHREILKQGHSDQEAKAHLLVEAQTRHESICPHCFAAIRAPDAPPLKPMETSRGRLTGEGYAVTVSESALWPRLRIDTPSGVLFKGAEPIAGTTAIALHWASLCVAMTALAAAFIIKPPWHVLTMIALLIEFVLLEVWAWQIGNRRDDPLDRAIDHAWQALVPTMQPGIALGRLALTSVGRGDPQKRVKQLQHLIETNETLAPLWWLRLMDMRAVGQDPLPELASLLGRCFAGQAPIAVAADVLALAQTGLHARADRARLRILAIEKAFAAGLSVRDLQELGRVFPAIGNILRTEDLEGIAGLRLIWDERESRPWRACGPATTVFQLARYPVLGGQVLAAEPDALLYQPLPPAGQFDDPAPVILCGRGLVFRHVLVRELPEHVWAWERPVWRGGGFELRMGEHRLEYDDDPTELAARLKRWADFWLREFLPRGEYVLRYRVTEHLTKLLANHIVSCPGCAKPVIPVAGKIAMEPTS